MNLSEFLVKQQTTLPLTRIIETIASVGVEISQLLQKGALSNILGSAGNENVQGETQQKLDVIANDLLLNALANNPHCAGVASEELDHATAAHQNGECLVLFDPLDGSSNIDINMAVGTIFSILPNTAQDKVVEDTDFLQKGTEQLAAGYIIYGPSTMMALTLKAGVIMFALNPDNQQWQLVKENISIAEDTQEYAINASNHRFWQPAMQQYINELMAGKDGVRGKNYNTRWVAAMVADVHRILCRGGIFMYPYDNKDPKKAGKLRLMYEANPMSLLIEQAGGLSTDATRRILDINPEHIHQRIPVVLGAKNEVLYVQNLHLNSE